MPAQKDRWVSFLVFLLFSISQCGSASLQQEPSPQHYFSGLEAGKASLQGLVRVNCPKEDVSRYCGKENALRKAFLFRGNRLIREFPTDALFDVNSIVANVLALLFNEVKYVETLADLENIENVLKGKSNMVFAYVPATGTAEHRAVMEAAFVYGTIHQFVLTTEAALLKATSPDDPDVSSAWLLFCHCQQVPEPAQACRRTALAQPLTLLNIHRHLKLMGAPLVTEVAEDPEKISTVHLQLGLPLVFILSQKDTYEADRRTAEFVAWQLLGKAGVALLSRDLVELNVLQRSNVALKTPDEVGGWISSLDSSALERVVGCLLISAIDLPAFPEAQGEVSFLIIQRICGFPIPGMFFSTLGTPGVLLSRVNCWDWPGLCSQENVTQFPTLRIYQQGQQPVTYGGMWGAEELSSFILLQVPCPLKLATMAEAEGYLRGEFPSELPSHHHTSLLGVFSSATSRGLLGLVGLKYSVSPPALLLARSGGRSVEGIALSEHSVQDMLQMIRYELLDIFPEITVPNLPQYLQLGKPFLILFSAGDISQVESEEMLKLAKGRPQQTFVVCWLNLKKTPVGYGILRTHFSTTPPLPLLLWVNLHAGGQVFKFPSEQPITEMNILLWLEKLQAGLEIPSSKWAQVYNVPKHTLHCSQELGLACAVSVKVLRSSHWCVTAIYVMAVSEVPP
uniref:Thioredoxin domain containing 16 n=1 Tax=Zonotrichia albicollis TaxID=44394 RepID=A0A8D2M9L3_ZONAL